MAINKLKCKKCQASILETTYNNNLGMCAPCYFKDAEEKELQHKLSIPGCPKCDGSNLIGFSWDMTLNKHDPLKSKYPKYLIESKQCKYGKKFLCSICESVWWLSEGNFMSFVPQDKIEIFEKWNNKYIVNFSHFRKLLNIKSAYRYSNEITTYTFPCAIYTKKGQYFEKVLLEFSRVPPLFQPSESVFFADEVKDVALSPYALPFLVRQATYNAPEVRMCFSPTIVRSNDGKNFTLNGAQHFLDYQGIKGEEISLVNMQHHDGLNAIYYKQDAVKYCLADLTILQNLIMKLSPMRYLFGK